MVCDLDRLLLGAMVVSVYDWTYHLLLKMARVDLLVLDLLLLKLLLLLLLVH